MDITCENEKGQVPETFLIPQVISICPLMPTSYIASYIQVIFKLYPSGIRVGPTRAGIAKYESQAPHLARTNPLETDK